MLFHQTGITINSNQIQTINLGEDLSRPRIFHDHSATKEQMILVATEYR
jgi:hypothetical protein